MDNLIFPHGGDIYRLKRKKIVDFSANINPLGLSNDIKTKLSRNLKSICHYPDPFGRGLVKEIARYWNTAAENILLGNGSAELIYLLVQALRPERALIPAPTFAEYELACRLVGAKTQFIKLREDEGFALNVPKNAEADIIFISNPNNPTANLLVNNNLSSLKARTIIVDEAFMDFLPDEKERTLIQQAKKNKRIIVLRSFTKFFALPGLRAGYLIAHQDIVKKLRKYAAPWNVNALAQLAAQAALRDKEYISKSRKFIARERTFLFNEINKIKNLQPYPAAANFILVRIKDAKISAAVLKERLLGKGILIRDCANFRNLNDKFIRLAVRTRRENKKLAAALAELL